MSTPPIRAYCTYFDEAYLARGNALLASLRRRAAPFRLCVLCLDEATWEAVRQEPDVSVLRLEDFEKEHPEVAATRSGRSRLEYYYTLTPFALRHILERSESDLLTYLDADLYFFDSPEPLFTELGDAPIGVVEHRFPAGLSHLAAYGRFNVGWVSFRRSAEASRCLERWGRQCLEWCYDLVEPARFGDQKYLDEWPALYPGLRILGHRGANVAPWNVSDHPVRREGQSVLVDGEPLLFYHFHGLRYDRAEPLASGLAPYGAEMSPGLWNCVYRPYLRAVLGAERRRKRKP